MKINNTEHNALLYTGILNPLYCKYYYYYYIINMCFLHSLLMHSATEINKTDQPAMISCSYQICSDSAAVWFMNSSGEQHIDTAGALGSCQLGYQGQVKSSPSRLWGSWPAGQQGKWRKTTHDSNCDRGQRWWLVLHNNPAMFSLKCVRCLQTETKCEQTSSSTESRQYLHWKWHQSWLLKWQTKPKLLQV